MKKMKYSYDKKRGSSTERGYDGEWRKAREVYLRENPLCRVCEARGDVVRATVIDHIIPHKRDIKLFWDVENWRSLCKTCHDLKTMRSEVQKTIHGEDGYHISL